MLDLSKKERHLLLNKLIQSFEQFYEHTDKLPVAPKLSKEEIKNFITDRSIESHEDAFDHVLEGLSKYAVHTPHPMYYGLFNPRSSFAGMAADTLTAFFNPQMAAWSHAPFAVEVEEYLIKELGIKFGFKEASIDGAFCSGGAEANLTAMICAAQFKFPGLKSGGWKSIPENPVIHCSEEAHHSVIKAAIITGLGSDAVRPVRTGSDLKMDIHDLHTKIIEDIHLKNTPFLVIATEGVTGTGVIDDIKQILTLKEKYGFWLHADAAYGGAVILSDVYKDLLSGIEKADSITFDAHKWLSVPMGAGIFITSHPEIMKQSFGLKTEYMPKDAEGMEVTDPFTHTIQWSRRFTGLKLYLSVLFYGWEGLAKAIDYQIKIGAYLKAELKKAGWKIYNSTSLPVVCFGKDSFEHNKEGINSFCQHVIGTGRTWISVYKIKEMYALRACITNYNTSKENIDELIQILDNSKF
ncbi:MAG: pyridoxal-dependent decarboxylase [Saprospiraceae bacterium]|nr:pyridoxal-dependent decarboxylase [Saprospiraceae bacterium]